MTDSRSWMHEGRSDSRRRGRLLTGLSDSPVTSLSSAVGRLWGYSQSCRIHVVGASYFKVRVTEFVWSSSTKSPSLFTKLSYLPSLQDCNCDRHNTDRMIFRLRPRRLLPFIMTSECNRCTGVLLQQFATSAIADIACCAGKNGKAVEQSRLSYHDRTRKDEQRA